MLLAVAAFVVALQWVKPAPPSRVVIATGRADGAYYRFVDQGLAQPLTPAECDGCWPSSTVSRRASGTSASR